VKGGGPRAKAYEDAASNDSESMTGKDSTPGMMRGNKKKGYTTVTAEMKVRLRGAARPKAS